MGIVRFDFLSPHGSTGPINNAQVTEGQTAHREIEIVGYISQKEVYPGSAGFPAGTQPGNVERRGDRIRGPHFSSIRKALSFAWRCFNIFQSLCYEYATSFGNGYEREIYLLGTGGCVICILEILLLV